MILGEDAMKLYMQHVGRYPLVTREEENGLALQIKNGSEQARGKLICSNLRLVVKIAHDFKGRGLPLLDLISEGNIGLARAVEKFDPAKGAKLSSYAAWWIKQAMRKALASQARTIRIPVQSMSKIAKIRDARVKLRNALGRDPTDAEVAHAVGLTQRTVAGLGRANTTTTASLDAPLQQGETNHLGDLVADTSAVLPTDVAGQRETVRRMLHLMERLDDRERKIITLRFGLDGERPRTLQEISDIIGRTRERIRQIQNSTLAKLHAMLEEDPCATAPSVA